MALEALQERDSNDEVLLEQAIDHAKVIIWHRHRHLYLAYPWLQPGLVQSWEKVYGQLDRVFNLAVARVRRLRRRV